MRLIRSIPVHRDEPAAESRCIRPQGCPETIGETKRHSVRLDRWLPCRGEQEAQVKGAWGGPFFQRGGLLAGGLRRRRHAAEAGGWRLFPSAPLSPQALEQVRGPPPARGPACAAPVRGSFAPADSVPPGRDLVSSADPIVHATPRALKRERHGKRRYTS